MSSNSESFGRRSSSPSRSDSGYSSSDRSAPTFGLNSVTPSTAPSTYAQSTCFDEHGDPVHSSTRSATSFRYGANTTRRPESVRSFASCSDVAATMKIDEDARYRAISKHLHAKACSMRWIEPGIPQPIAKSGVLIRNTDNEYVTEPRNIDQGLLAAIRRINPSVALTMSTDSTDAVFDMLGDGLMFKDGSQIQIYESLDAIVRSSSIKKFQYAAFVRQERILLVWHDYLSTILSRAMEVDSKIFQLVCGPVESGLDGSDSELQSKEPSYAGSTVDLTTKEAKGHEDHIDKMDSDMGDYHFDSPESLDRPQIVTSAIFVSLGVFMMTFLVFGYGNRALEIQTITDHYYPRLALILTEPLFFCLGLFFVIVIFNNCFQLLGPMALMKMNSRFCSAIKPNLAQARRYGFTPPSITIQMPIYTESLEKVIKPTVASLQAAISHYELRGGTARIFINDDGMAIRSEADNVRFRNFYANNNIGWVSRPKHNDNGFIRRGKFKKASNMNFALHIATCVEDALQESLENLTEKELNALTEEWELELYEDALQHVLQKIPRAKAGGDIRIGEIILIVDSDTIIPEDCLMYGAAEMFLSPEVAIVQHNCGVMQVSWDFFENAFAYFTNLVYSAIRFAVGSGETAPFIGHNAFLRWTAMQDVAMPPEGDNYVRYWSESHVSEDFDMALRLQIKGYILRLASYHGGGFKEGISLSIFDELNRWEKYAYGCNELVFNPLFTWLWKGPFTPLFRTFLGCDLQLSSKMTIIGYISSYYSLASSIPLGLLNYFLIGWLNGELDKFYVQSWQVFVSLIVVFNIFSNVCLAVMRYRLGEMGFFASLLENFTWMPLFMVFFGGISWHLLLAICAHFFGINMTWGATGKEKTDTSFFKELLKIWKRFRVMWAVMLSTLGGMIYLGCFVPHEWGNTGTTSIVPMAFTVVMHILFPIVMNPVVMLFGL